MPRVLEFDLPGDGQAVAHLGAGERDFEPPTAFIDSYSPLLCWYGESWR